ncbi:MAG: hypothetical protein P8J45_01095 [Phycisphaerales bacterium]|nr:hypothetical protein [Phycisphaerales bacterium]
MNRNLHVVFLGLVVGVWASTSVSYGQGLHGKPASFRGVVKDPLYVKGLSRTGARDGMELDPQTKSYETDRVSRSQIFEAESVSPIASSVNNTSEAEVGNRSVRVKRFFSQRGLDRNSLNPYDSIEDQVDSLRARTDGPLVDDLGNRNASAMAYGEAQIPTYYLVPGYVVGIDLPWYKGRLQTFTTQVEGKITISCEVGNDTMTAGRIWRRCGPSKYSAIFDDDQKKWFIHYVIRVDAAEDVDDGEQDGWIWFEGWSDDHNLPAFEMTTVFICGEGHFQERHPTSQTSHSEHTVFGCSALTEYTVEPTAGNLEPGPLEDENFIKVTNTLEVSGTLYDPPWDDRP